MEAFSLLPVSRASLASPSAPAAGGLVVVSALRGGAAVRGALVGAAGDADGIAGVSTAGASTAMPAERPKRRRRALLNLVALGVLVLAAAVVLAKPGSGLVPTDNASAAITYQLAGSATSASITYTDGSGNIQQQTDIAVPLVRKSGAGGIAFSMSHGDFVSFSAQNNGGSGDLTCTIESDGVVINRGHASGAYSIVSCSAQVP